MTKIALLDNQLESNHENKVLYYAIHQSCVFDNIVLTGFLLGNFVLYH